MNTGRELEIYTYLSPTDQGDTVDQVREVVTATTGVDRGLIGYHSFGPDPFVLGASTLTLNPSVNVLIAHRPGVVSPTVTARMLATLSRLSGGRVDLHIVTGGAPGDQYREGDYLDHDDRYQRAREYVEVLRQIWTTEEPFSYEGDFYKVEDVRPNRPAGDVRIHMGGASPAGLQFGASTCDVYMLWGEPISEVETRIKEIADAASSYGRPRPRISLSLRLYVGETEDAAWEHARSDPYYQKYLAKGGSLTGRDHAEDAGRNRQLGVVRRGEVHDDCLWMGIVAAQNGLGNAAALVGTEDRVMATLEQYRSLGVDTFLVAGDTGNWDPALASTTARMKREL